MSRTVTLPCSDTCLAQMYVCGLFLSVKETEKKPKSFVSMSFPTHTGQLLPPLALHAGAEKKMLSSAKLPPGRLNK